MSPLKRIAILIMILVVGGTAWRIVLEQRDNNALAAALTQDTGKFADVLTCSDMYVFAAEADTNNTVPTHTLNEMVSAGASAHTPAVRAAAKSLVHAKGEALILGLLRLSTACKSIGMGPPSS